MCVYRFSLQLLSEIFLILRLSELQIYVGLHVNYLIFLSDFSRNSIFLIVFLKIKNIKFRENLFVGS